MVHQKFNELSNGGSRFKALYQLWYFWFFYQNSSIIFKVLKWDLEIVSIRWWRIWFIKTRVLEIFFDWFSGIDLNSVRFKATKIKTSHLFLDCLETRVNFEVFSTFLPKKMPRGKRYNNILTVFKVLGVVEDCRRIKMAAFKVAYHSTKCFVKNVKTNYCLLLCCVCSLPSNSCFPR